MIYFVLQFLEVAVHGQLLLPMVRHHNMVPAHGKLLISRLKQREEGARSPYALLSHPVIGRPPTRPYLLMFPPLANSTKLETKSLAHGTWGTF
jgi:hypothetical protein